MSDFKQLLASLRRSPLVSLLLQVAVGVAYTTLQILLIRSLAFIFGQPVARIGLIGTVILTTSASLTALFLINRYTLKASTLTLGISCSVVFFVYFYLIRSQYDPITTLLGVATHWPSLVNMVIAVIGPVLVGIWLRPNNSFKPTPLRGAA